MMGVQACIAGLANVLPELANKLYEAARSGNLILARELQNQVLIMWDILHYGNSNPTAYAMLHIRGIDVGYPRKPMLPLGKETYGKVESAMQATQSIWSA